MPGTSMRPGRPLAGPGWPGMTAGMATRVAPALSSCIDRRGHRDPAVGREPAHEHQRQAGRRPRHSVRPPSPRPADGCRRHRRRRRHLEAQCAVSARRPPRRFLRLHGCDRRHPLSAGAGLCQGRAGEGGLYRSPPGEIPARGEPAVDAGDADQQLGLGRRHAEGGRSHEEGRPRAQAHCRRVRLPALRRRRKCCARVPRRRLGRCALCARTSAREEVGGQS